MTSIFKTVLFGMAVVASTGAMADISNFTGPEVGATVTAGEGKIKFKEHSISGTSADAALHAGYGLEVSEDFVVLFGLDYNLSKLKAGRGERQDGSTDNIYFKNPYSLSLGAGKPISENTLGFAKVSYESTKLSGGEANIDLRGYGLGAGVRRMIDKNMYPQAEFKYTKYTKATGVSMDNIEITNTQFNFGVGYQF